MAGRVNGAYGGKGFMMKGVQGFMGLWWVRVEGSMKEKGLRGL